MMIARVCDINATNEHLPDLKTKLAIFSLKTYFNIEKFGLFYNMHSNETIFY